LKHFHLFFDADIGIELRKSEVAHVIRRRFRDALQEEATRILELEGWTVISAHVECSGAEKRTKTETVEATRERAGGSVLVLGTEPRWHPRPFFKRERVIGWRKSRL
jgi:hypothetical protein